MIVPTAPLPSLIPLFVSCMISLHIYSYTSRITHSQQPSSLSFRLHFLSLSSSFLGQQSSMTNLDNCSYSTSISDTEISPLPNLFYLAHFITNIKLLSLLSSTSKIQIIESGVVSSHSPSVGFSHRPHSRPPLLFVHIS